MSDPVTIANLLKSTLTGANQAIKNAEKSLSQLQSDPNFLPHLLLIPKQQNLPKNIRKAAAIYTKHYVRNVMIQKDQTKINAAAQLLLNQLSFSSIDISIRKHLAATLQYLLTHDQKQIVRQTFHAHCIKIMQAAKTQDDQKVNFEFIGFFVQVLMSSFIHLSKQTNAFIQNSISIFCQLNLRVFKYVMQAVSEESKEKIMQIFKILKLFSYTIKAYLKKILLAELQTVKMLYDDALILLINTSLNFILKNNTIPTTLIFYNEQADAEVVDLFHSIKADYIEGVFYIMRTIFMQFKDAKMIQANPILSNPALIPSFINSLSQLFNKIPYYKIKSQSLVKLVEQIINCQIISVRNSFYFASYQQYQKPIVHGFILKVLAFSPIDYETFVDDPNQLINQLLQIVQMDSDEYLKQKRKEGMLTENSQQIQEYSTLRTLTATFLQAYCKHIDGSLAQILQFSLNVLKNQISSDFPKSLILLMLCILKTLILGRKSQRCEIITIVSGLLKNRQIPLQVDDLEGTSTVALQANIQYLMLLISVFQFLSSVEHVTDDQVYTLYQVVCNIFGNPNAAQAIQFEALDLTISISERQPHCQVKFIEILDEVIINNTVQRQKSLQTLQSLFKMSNQGLSARLDLVAATVKMLSNLVQAQLQKKPSHKQIIINKCWNVIADICQNQLFIPKLIPQIQQAVMPLIKYIDGETNYDYEENIFMLMSSFIQKSKAVTQNELVMFQIIPKLFYTQYSRRFGHAFETLHIFIFYGSNILASAPQAIKAIVQMAFSSMNAIEVEGSPRNQAENCEGVLILQSLILSCGNSFTVDIWLQIAKALTKRLESPPVKGHILHSNILAALALIVMIGYKSFSVEDCDVILNRILQNHYCFVVKYSVELAIIALSQVLCLYNLPFVTNRFTYILDTILNLLEAKDNKQIFDKNPITQQQKDYDIQMQTIFNMVKNIDQIDHFKAKLLLIKQQNLPLLQKTISELPERKAEFLRKIMNVQKVMNQNRVIFKIKK